MDSHSPELELEDPLADDNSGGKQKKRRIRQACKICSGKKIKCDGQQPCASCVQAGNGNDCLYGEKKKRGPPKGYTRAVKLDADGQPVPRKSRKSAAAASPSPVGLPYQPPTSAPEAQSFSSPVEKYTMHSDYSAPLGPAGLLPFVENGYARYPPTKHFGPSNGFRDNENIDLHMSGQPDAIFRGLAQWSQDHHDVVMSLPQRPPASDHASTSNLINSVRNFVRSDDHWIDRHFFYQIARQEVEEYQKQDGALGSQGLNFDYEVPEEIINSLLELFWNYVFPFFPYLSADRPEFRTAKHLKRWPLLFNACLSTVIGMVDAEWLSARAGSHIAQNPNLSLTSLGHLFVNRARYELLKTDWQPSMSTIQGVMYLAMREHGHGRWSHLWQYIGLAGRMCLDMGLHRLDSTFSSGAGEDLSANEKETRRRVFWACFFYDKTTAAISGRPPMLLSDDCDVHLPQNRGDDDAGFWMSVFFQPPEIAAHYSHRPKNCVKNFRLCIQVMQILEMVLKKIYSLQSRKHYKQTGEAEQNLQELSSRLQDWRLSIPHDMEWRAGNCFQLPHIYNMHLWYFLTQILLHRTFVPSLFKTQYRGRPMPSSHVLCTQAADCIRELIAQFKRNFTLRRTTTSAHYGLFLASTIYIANATSLDEAFASRARQNYEQCLSFLQEISTNWIAAEAHAEILKKLYKIATEARPALVPLSTLEEAPSTNLPFNIPPITDLNGQASIQPPTEFDLAFWNHMPHSLDQDQWEAFSSTYQSA